MNFKDYKTNARYAQQINAGYSARLNNDHSNNDYLTEEPKDEAFRHGWFMADQHEQTNRSEK